MLGHLLSWVSHAQHGLPARCLRSRRISAQQARKAEAAAAAAAADNITDGVERVAAQVSGIMSNSQFDSL